MECQFLSHWYDSTPEKSRRNGDSNPGSSALEADALTTRPTRRSPTQTEETAWVAHERASGNLPYKFHDDDDKSDDDNDHDHDDDTDDNDEDDVGEEEKKFVCGLLSVNRYG